MAIAPYLAMTAAEIAENRRNYPNIAWLSCHFSTAGPGLDNLPQQLPKGSLLTLNDEIPMGGHDPDTICELLSGVIFRFGCTGLLLDFQRPFDKRLHILSKLLSQALPCPVAVSESYAKDLDCPVFLSPLPLHRRLENHIAPWQGRKIWLDFSAEAEQITVTDKGSNITPLPCVTGPETGFQENTLHCHYSISLTDTAAEFTLWRTKEDTQNLLKEAENCGITAAVGLFQELQKFLPFF